MEILFFPEKATPFCSLLRQSCDTKDLSYSKFQREKSGLWYLTYLGILIDIIIEICQCTFVSSSVPQQSRMWWWTACSIPQHFLIQKMLVKCYNIWNNHKATIGMGDSCTTSVTLRDIKVKKTNKRKTKKRL